MAKYLIAHDLGTSGNKATLFDIEKGPVKHITVSYDVHFFNRNYAEQDANDWWRAVCVSTKQIMEGISPGQIAGISFSAQMQCCLPVDKAGNPLRPAIIWADGRAVEETKTLIHALGEDEIYRTTGHRPSPNYTLEKLMWIRENEPDIYNQTYKVLQAKDFVIHKLTGNFVTDYSDASGTNMLNLDTLSWSEDILKASGISEALMPELHRSVDVVGYVTTSAASETGLSEGTPVVCGGGDGPCSAIGAGCVSDDAFFSSFGTSAWIGGTTKEKVIDPDKICFYFAHVIPGRYMPCGTMQAAGSSYSYIKSVLAPDMSYEELNHLMETSSPGSKGLIFLPYLLGERSPRWNERTSGAFLGIKPEHTKADYVRAVMEGVGYNLDIILHAFRKHTNISQLVLTGGGAAGDVVCRILADIFDAKLIAPSDAQGATSVAAALIAGVGIGAYPGFEAYQNFIQYDKAYTPNASNTAAYGKYKKIFDDSYHALYHVFDSLYDLR